MERIFWKENSGTKQKMLNLTFYSAEPRLLITQNSLHSAVSILFILNVTYVCCGLMMLLLCN